MQCEHLPPSTRTKAPERWAFSLPHSLSQCQARFQLSDTQQTFDTLVKSFRQVRETLFSHTLIILIFSFVPFPKFALVRLITVPRGGCIINVCVPTTNLRSIGPKQNLKPDSVTFILTNYVTLEKSGIRLTHIQIDLHADSDGHLLVA